jgi:hypothetical protein
MAHWYVSRRIPVAVLNLQCAKCPTKMISMNSVSLKEVTFFSVSLMNEDIVSLGNCSKIKILSLWNCSFPVNCQISSILENFTSLEALYLDCIPFSRSDVEVISRCCRFLKSLKLSFVNGVGDQELRILVEGCPMLSSLKLSYLDITDESVRMLVNRSPQFSSIGLSCCDRVSPESVMFLIRQFVILQLDDDVEELQLSALDTLSFSISCSSQPQNHLEELLSQDSLFERFVKLISLKNRVRSHLLSLVGQLSHNGYDRVVLNFLPVMIHHFSSFDQIEKSNFLTILNSFPDCRLQFLASGVLSIFRPPLLHVRLSPTELTLNSLLVP